MQSQQTTTFKTTQKHHFNRLFPELSPLQIADKDLLALTEFMKETAGNEKTDSKVITNGLAIFSQFLAHDMTFESTSKFHGRGEIGLFQNDRTINLDLDCLYGQKSQSFFYNAEDGAKLLLGKKYSCGEAVWFDLQRNSQQKAIIPDARNDENIIVSRQQVLFIHFHNKLVDYLREKDYKGDVFAEAKQLVRRHYHWLIIHEYLYKIMDWDIFDEIKEKGCRFYTQAHALPLEFTGAAFRAGHSQTRQLNRINENTKKDLFALGSFTSMEEYVDWRYLFNFGDGRCQFAKLIDTKIGTAFHDIPFIKKDNPAERSLPFLNLRRGVLYGLPSGEAVANRMGFEPIEVEETAHLGGTPLWYYVLKEAEILGHKGEHLGLVGSTILGECFFTVMRTDDYSFLKIHPKWRPTLGKEVGKFDFLDMIWFVAR